MAMIRYPLALGTPTRPDVSGDAPGACAQPALPAAWRLTGLRRPRCRHALGICRDVHRRKLVMKGPAPDEPAVGRTAQSPLQTGERG